MHAPIQYEQAYTPPPPDDNDNDTTAEPETEPEADAMDAGEQTAHPCATPSLAFTPATSQ
ncbi:MULTISPECIES: hypothetical protein [unclassified Actinomyces]|uniref:hypothetical protein n=1 Tax=unclassified Actinomyces TaxID=2609248 RepID=UPI000D5A245B|nr:MULTISPECIES: hypothetical protein [unclassified Actinomyces]RAX22752.1 hypothetical protein DRB07_07250 [Actinomyces sp. Z3]